MNTDQSEETKKWAWMMQFCKDVGVSPSDAYWWGRAEKEYNNQKNKEPTNE